jgi:hypothetical protein
MNIKIENYGDMFRFTEPSAGQIQNTVLVQSMSAHSVFELIFLCHSEIRESRCFVYSEFETSFQPKTTTLYT